MLKKSLLFMAIVTAAAAAQAGNVQVYGVVDAGVAYNKAKVSGDFNFIGAKDSFKVNESSTKLATGKHSGNRFGIKGTEEIAPNLKAGFVLEGGFDLLNGDLADKGKLFNRQADLFVEGDFGHLAFGRMGTLTSANGSYAIFSNIADNFAGGWGNTIGARKLAFVNNLRADNTVTYASPEIAGAQLFAQYSFNLEGAQQDKLRENDRYAAIGATYKLDNLQVVGVFDKTFFNNKDLHYLDKGTTTHKPSVISDAWTINLGAAYEIEKVKLTAAYQHGDHSKGFGPYDSKVAFNSIDSVLSASSFLKTIATKAVGSDAARLDMMINHANGMKSDTFAFGTDVVVGNGVVKAQVFHARAKLHTPYQGQGGILNFQAKARTTGIALGYEHNLSKRTELYVGGGYSETKLKNSFEYLSEMNKFKFDAKLKTFEAVAGLVHKF